MSVENTSEIEATPTTASLSPALLEQDYQTLRGELQRLMNERQRLIDQRVRIDTAIVTQQGAIAYIEQVRMRFAQERSGEQ